MPDFCHLHCHTHYSLLDGASDIGRMMDKAVLDGQKGVALTDHGNMFGAFHFVNGVINHNKKVVDKNKENLKRYEATKNGTLEEGQEPLEELPEPEVEITPIIGCEFQVCEDHTNKSQKDNGYQIVMLAKNKTGYLNLAKMSSIAFVDGKYYVPRIDKKVIEQYKEDIIQYQ